VVHGGGGGGDGGKGGGGGGGDGGVVVVVLVLVGGTDTDCSVNVGRWVARSGSRGPDPDVASDDFRDVTCASNASYHLC